MQLIQPERDQEQTDVVAGFLKNFTVETTPQGASKISDFREHLRPGTGVFITLLPGSDIGDVVATAIRLRGEGFNPIPHLAARSIPNKTILQQALERLTDRAGLKEVLLIAGSVNEPVGDFSDTMQLLDTGLFEKFNISRIAVAGHPEGSPDISDEGIRSALQWKNEFATKTGLNLHIVTQFCFEARPIIDWERRIFSDGNRLPIYIGIPGLATIKSLLHHAKMCGVGPSMKFLTRQARYMTKLLTLSAPDALVLDLAKHCQNNQTSLIRGVHIYPLGGLKQSARWAYGVADRNSKFNPDLD